VNILMHFLVLYLTGNIFVVWINSTCMARSVWLSPLYCIQYKYCESWIITYKSGVRYNVRQCEICNRHIGKGTATPHITPLIFRCEITSHRWSTLIFVYDPCRIFWMLTAAQYNLLFELWLRL
jgi:hypothetical protein